MLVLGAPPQAISHKNSLDICLSNIGGRRRHEHEQPRRVDCVEAGALMRATALALDAVKSLEDRDSSALGIPAPVAVTASQTFLASRRIATSIRHRSMNLNALERRLRTIFSHISRST
jgi:hypothetical protein